MWLQRIAGSIKHVVAVVVVEVDEVVDVDNVDVVIFQLIVKNR